MCVCVCVCACVCADTSFITDINTELIDNSQSLNMNNSVDHVLRRHEKLLSSSVEFLEQTSPAGQKTRSRVDGGRGCIT